jgi:hypothetical protein
MVLNKNKDVIPANAIYIGRGSKWGNPFIIGKDGNRNDVCEKYNVYIKEQIKSGKVTLQEVAELDGKDLVCFCAPERCHGHSLEKIAQWAFAKLYVY